MGVASGLARHLLLDSSGGKAAAVSGALPAEGLPGTRSGAPSSLGLQFASRRQVRARWLAPAAGDLAAALPPGVIRLGAR